MSDDEVHVKKEKKPEQKGLKRMRAGATGPTPTYHCDNCKCNRYSQCGCQKKAQ